MRLAFRLDAERGVRHDPQTLLGNQLARFATNPVGLVLDADERRLQMLDKFQLPLRQPSRFLLGQRSGPLLQYLERRRGILYVIAGSVRNRGT